MAGHSNLSWILLPKGAHGVAMKKFGIANEL